MKTRRCGNCGSKNVKEVKNAGPFVWKDFPSVFLDQSISMLTCKNCGESILSLDDGPKIDKLIEASVTRNVRSFIKSIIERESAMQTTLSERLGVTPEYLSEIKSGRKLPSFQTYNFLKVLAMDKEAYNLSDPKTRVKAG